MASYIDMSLEDIIQKKKRENTTKKNKLKPPILKKQTISKNRSQITDARQKIISKKRTQIKDAREKLAELAKQKDARLKLEQLRMKRAGNQYQDRKFFVNRKKIVRAVSNKDMIFTDSTRQVVSQPLNVSRMLGRRQINTRNQIEKRPRIHRKYDSLQPIIPIVRTIENDIELIDDPMGEEYVPQLYNPVAHKGSLQLKITTRNSDSRDGRVSRTLVAEAPKSPPRPPSILKKRPMASLKNEKTTDNSSKPNLEYRIIVSNLRNTVTGGDIEELFGDVGTMQESRLVRPGTAEVIYKTLEDAQRAVDLYHNRQLDGQPMNCLLVTPRSTSTSRSGNKPALISSSSNVEPDISTFHKVLFSNF